MGPIKKIKNFIKSPDSYTMLIVPLTFLISLNSILFFWYYKSDYHNLGTFFHFINQTIWNRASEYGQFTNT